MITYYIFVSYSFYIMPFTLSHAVLAPPISKLSGQRLPIAAVAIGTMTPDLYRIMSKTEILVNHQFKGLIQPDLWVGLFFCLLWYGLYRPVIYKILAIKDDLQLDSSLAYFKFILMICIAIIVGTCTHIIWDGLTHLDFRTLAFQNFLSRPVHIFSTTYPMHRVLQIASSAIALPFLVWMTLHYYFKYKIALTNSHLMKNTGIFILIFSSIVGCIYYIYIAKNTGFIPQSNDLYDVFGFFFKFFSQGALICFTLLCLVFRVFIERKDLG